MQQRNAGPRRNNGRNASQRGGQQFTRHQPWEQSPPSQQYGQGEQYDEFDSDSGGYGFQDAQRDYPRYGGESERHPRQEQGYGYSSRQSGGRAYGGGTQGYQGGSQGYSQGSYGGSQGGYGSAQGGYGSAQGGYGGSQGDYGGQDFQGAGGYGQSRARRFAESQGYHDYEGPGSYQASRGRFQYDEDDAYGPAMYARGSYGGAGYGSPDDAGRFNPQSQFDPDYTQWRSEQLRSFDDDYRNWRKERYGKFSDEFNQWRQSRQGGASSDRQSTSSSGDRQGASSSDRLATSSSGKDNESSTSKERGK